MHIKQETTQIYIHNKFTITLARNPLHHERNKHIDLKFHFFREHVKTNEAKLTHIKAQDQVIVRIESPLREGVN